MRVTELSALETCSSVSALYARVLIIDKCVACFSSNISVCCPKKHLIPAFYKEKTLKNNECLSLKVIGAECESDFFPVSRTVAALFHGKLAHCCSNRTAHAGKQKWFHRVGIHYDTLSNVFIGSTHPTECNDIYNIRHRISKCNICIRIIVIR